MDKQITVDGLRVTYYQSAVRRARKLLVVNGWSANYSNWESIAAQLESDFEVFSPNFPGFWRSEPLKGEYNIQSLANFLLSFLKAVRLSEVYCLADSLGAEVVLFASAVSPLVFKKICFIGLPVNHSRKRKLLGRIINILAHRQFFIGLFDYIRRNVFVLGWWRKLFLQIGPPERDYCADILRKAAASESRIWLTVCSIALVCDSLSGLRRSNIPILLIYGDRDPFKPDSQELRTLSSKVRYEFVPGRHAPLNDHPREVARLIGRFLNGVS